MTRQMYSYKEPKQESPRVVRETASLFAPQHEPELPVELLDNTTEGLRALLAANDAFRQLPWPAPYDATSHEIRLGDARDLSWLAEESVDLVVT